MKGGSCRVSMGQESGFSVSDTAFDGIGSNPVSGINLSSSRFEIGKSCNTQPLGHAMIS